MVAVPLEIPLHLLFKLRGFPSQGFENVFNQGRGLIWIQTAAADPLLRDTSEALRDQGGGPKAAEQHLLKGIAGVHRKQLAWLQDDPGRD